MLHYYPRHVSSINMPIFRRTNCTHTASSIVALCKRLHSTPVESRLLCRATVYSERRYQMLCVYNWSSWRWACWCSKHVEECSVTYILLMNKALCIKVGKWNNSILLALFLNLTLLCIRIISCLSVIDTLWTSTHVYFNGPHFSPPPLPGGLWGGLHYNPYSLLICCLSWPKSCPTFAYW